MDSLWKARERAFLSFFRFLGDFASAEATRGLSDRPLETFGPMQRTGFSTENGFFVEDEGKASLAFFCFTEGFASAEATRGLSHRPPGPIWGETLFASEDPYLASCAQKIFSLSPKE